MGGRESVNTADKGTQDKNVESEDCSEEEIETVKELEETNIQIHIIRPHMPIDGNKNKRNDDIDKENKGEMDKELKNNKIVTGEKEFSNTILNSITDIIENKGENSKRNKKIIGEQDLPKTIRIETNEMNEFINEISKREKYVTEMIEIGGENPERDKETTKRQNKNNNKEYNKENQEIFTTQELENDKKDKKVIDNNIIVKKINCLNKISTIGKPLTNIIK